MSSREQSLSALARAWLVSYDDHEQAHRAAVFLRQVLQAARTDPHKRSLNALAAPVAHYIIQQPQAWAFCKEIGVYLDNPQTHLKLDRVSEGDMQTAIDVIRKEEERARDKWEEAEDPMNIQSTLRLLRAKHRAKADQNGERKKVLQQIQDDQKERQADDRSKRSSSQETANFNKC